MKRKHTSAADPTPIRVVVLTLDSHMASATERAQHSLLKEMPGLRLALHAAAEWDDEPAALQRCIDDIAEGDIIVVSMMFMDDHIQAVMPALQARRESCDAMVVCMSAGEVVKLTRLGRFDMSGTPGGPMALLKRLRGGSKKTQGGAGQQQLRMLKRIPKILRYIPGPAQDVRAYFLTMQYLFAGSDDNIASLVRFLVDRYAAGPREGLRGTLKAALPTDYPDIGVYHPRMKGRIGDRREALPGPPGKERGTVGLLIMRSYILAGNTGHYDGVISALEAQGLRVVPAFATGLDARPAVEKFFMKDGRTSVDAVVSLTGFSLVGGPAYNDARAAEEVLASLDVPYLAAMPVEFQTLDQWEASDRGLMPVESTIMVAIPELDGSTGPMVFGGRSGTDPKNGRDMSAHGERAAMLAKRVARLVAMRQRERAQRKVAVVLFNFPPNAGNTGTAAYLSVFSSLYNTLKALAADGYDVDLPASVDELRERIVTGNAARFGAHANVHTRIPVDDHLRREPHLREIEAQWGPAPGKQQSDGSSIFVLGAQFGNVFVGVQPSFGYEGDPMRLLFDKGFAPTHAFSAFYRYLREDFGADAVLHFGTHGALEFMPGKQAGMSAACWPDRLIGDLPNVYLYASNNPSEGTIAKRRAAATLVSYLTPPIGRAGLYRGLTELKESIEHWRTLPPDGDAARAETAPVIQAQAAALELCAAEPAWGTDAQGQVETLLVQVTELEETLIPYGLHIVGEPPAPAHRVDMLLAVAESAHGWQPERAKIEALVAGSLPASELEGAEDAPRSEASVLKELGRVDGLLSEDHELPAILRALDGRFIRPVPGGDLLRTTAILPTGRNLHGFDPFRMPSAFAVRDGEQQTERLLQRHRADGHGLPESVALVLWGTDNLKTEGGPIAQALALLGARPRFDGYGRLIGAELIPLEELGRPRIDVLITLSGIFRDLLPLQIRMLAEAAFLAASADEPAEMNFVRKHTLAYLAEHGGDLETAALRVFSNADSAYGSNVNNLVDSSRWDHEDELAETYTRRKCFAYGRKGRPAQQSALLERMLKGVDLAYQNLDSVELGVTTVDHYFDTLGGVSRAVQRASGCLGAGLHRRPDPERRPGAHAQRAGRAGDPDAHAQPQVVRGHAGTRLRGRAADRGARHQYARLVRDHRPGRPWVYQQLTQTYVLDPAMRERLARLNPTASAKVANRLIEAHERAYWTPDDATLEALRKAGEELEDRLEGVGMEAAA